MPEHDDPVLSHPRAPFAEIGADAVGLPSRPARRPARTSRGPGRSAPGRGCRRSRGSPARGRPVVHSPPAVGITCNAVSGVERDSSVRQSKISPAHSVMNIGSYPSSRDSVISSAHRVAGRGKPERPECVRTTTSDGGGTEKPPGPADRGPAVRTSRRNLLAAGSVRVDSSAIPSARIRSTTICRIAGDRLAK